MQSDRDMFVLQHVQSQTEYSGIVPHSLSLAETSTLPGGVQMFCYLACFVEWIYLARKLADWHSTLEGLPYRAANMVRGETKGCQNRRLKFEELPAQPSRAGLEGAHLGR